MGDAGKGFGRLGTRLVGPLFWERRVSTELVRYNAMCTAIAEAKRVDEVRDIRDKAEALRINAKQAKNREAEIDYAEVRIRAERRVGELMQAQRDTIGLANGGDAARSARGLAAPELRPTLADAGTDKTWLN